jgi:hypothetical protein
MNPLLALDHGMDRASQGNVRFTESNFKRLLPTEIGAMTVAEWWACTIIRTSHKFNFKRTLDETLR